MKNKTNFKTQGKKNRQAGARFERKVRADLEKKGWIVDRWSNNVEFEQIEYPVGSNHGTEIGKLIPAKNKWAGPGRPMMIGAGFCDFICFRQFSGKEILEMMKNE